jgi:hypothetical protein
MPSLDTLVQMARVLDTTLDHLVLGIEENNSIGGSNTWIAHMETTFRDVAAQADSIRQTINRVGAMLAGRIEEVVREAQGKYSPPGGALAAEEIVRIERFATRIQLVTADPDLDIREPIDEVGNESAVAPGPFVGVIARNLLHNAHYEYVLPTGDEWRRRAVLLRREVGRELVALGEGETDLVLDAHLQFFSSSRGLMPGYVIYALDLTTMASDDPLLLDQITTFVWREQNTGSKMAVLACVIPTNLQFNMFGLISPEFVPAITRDYARTRETAAPLRFTGSATEGM